MLSTAQENCRLAPVVTFRDVFSVFAKRVRGTHKKKGDWDVATGIVQSTLSAFEHGRRKVDSDHIESILAAAGISVADALMMMEQIARRLEAEALIEGVAEDRHQAELRRQGIETVTAKSGAKLPVRPEGKGALEAGLALAAKISAERPKRQRRKPSTPSSERPSQPQAESPHTPRTSPRR